MKESLTSAERSKLKGLAQVLKPAIQVGKNGITDQVIREIEQAIKIKELIKVKFVGERDEIEALTQEVVEKTHSHYVGGVGKVSIFYRENPLLREEKTNSTKKPLKNRKR